MKTEFRAGITHAALSSKNIFFFLLFFVSATYGQVTSSSNIGLYSWRDEVFIRPCLVTGAPDANGIVITSKTGQKFRVLQVNGDSAIIKILDYTSYSKTPSPWIKRVFSRKEIKELKVQDEFFKYNYKGDITLYEGLPKYRMNARDYGDNQAYFKVPTNLINQYANKETRIGGSLAAGVINFPFKYRPQKNNADFSGAFNFGVGVGYTFPHKTYRRFVWSALMGYSISNVVLDSSSTNQNQNQLATTNNFTALSLSVGGMVQYGKVQAGLFLGWDRLSKINQRQFDWQYNSKPWISIGLGLAIFSEQNEKESRTPVVTQ